ncbi:MAG: T9SS type A sorting domain-containing protein [Chitinophagales bacterium]
MKKWFTKAALSLYGLLRITQVIACDNSSFELVTMNDLGGGQYEFTVTFCCGGGYDGIAYGAESYTLLWGVQAVGISSFASYPATLTSPQTGNVYAADNAFTYGSDLLLYDDPTYSLQTWGDIRIGTGAPGSYCSTFTFVTNGMPTQLILMGAEGNGVGVAPYGCNGMPEMEINFDVAADAGVYQVICEGSAATLTATATGGTPPYTYIWSNGATTATTTVSPVANTTYTVTVTDDNGHTDTDDVPIFVNPRPVVNAGADASITFGYGASCVTLHGTASGASSPYTYSWSNGTSGANNTVCPSTTTAYTLTVSDYYGCTRTDDVTVDWIDVRCGPHNNKVYVCKNGTTKCINSGQVNSYLMSGYTLGACWMRLDDATAESENPISIFPNPASTQADIAFILQHAGVAQIDIFDASGRRQIAQQSVSVESNMEYVQNIRIADLPSGLYFVMITNEAGERLTQKLQVLH